jgi:hypothetical protein
MRSAAAMRAMVTTTYAVAIVALAPIASAQGLGYGVTGGVTLANLHEDPAGEAPSFDFRVGLVVGGFVTWPLGSRLELQPEVLFTQKGAKLNQSGGTSTQKLDYVDVPVLASYRIHGARERHLAVFGGPAFGIRVRARSSASFGGSTFEDDVSDQVKRSDLAVVAGLAYHRGRFVVDGRYSWGLMDIDEDTTDDIKIKNRGISFLAGWKF